MKKEDLKKYIKLFNWSWKIYTIFEPRIPVLASYHGMGEYGSYEYKFYKDYLWVKDTQDWGDGYGGLQVRITCYPYEILYIQGSTKEE